MLSTMTIEMPPTCTRPALPKVYAFQLTQPGCQQSYAHLGMIDTTVEIMGFRSRYHAGGPWAWATPSKHKYRKCTTITLLTTSNLHNINMEMGLG
jgi:hypothetical protein